MEITGPLDITPDEESLLDMHSVLNVLNVINYELSALADDLDQPQAFDAVIDQLMNAATSLRNRDQAHRQVENIEDFIAQIEAAFVDVRLANPGAQERIAESHANLTSIFAVLRVRAREIVARAADPNGWVEHDICQLRHNFVEVLRAIERNSHGGYRVVYNLAEHNDGDYLVNLTINSVNGRTVAMPAVFQDVMRDLLANARKYTAPGGRIDAGLYQSATELRFVVEDNGRGIPDEDLPRVVEFGYRAANVRRRPTRGGGFGLTKSWYVTRRFGGRMWVDSPIAGGGTRVEIRLPV